MGRRARFVWSETVERCLKVLAPPEKLSVSQWSEKYRVLNAKASAMPGPWRNSVTPYLVGIMDAMDDRTVEVVTFCKPTQVGGTEVELNFLGKVIGTDPSPTLVVYPTEDLAKTVSNNRIRPMLEACPQLMSRWHPDISTQTSYQFDGMFLGLAWAGSVSGLASNPIRILLMDEVDKYPSNLGKEADPISLARERTKTFDNRKIYITSTPTLASGAIWRTLQSADCEMHYFVPCPHCASMIQLRFEDIRFPGEEGELSRDERAAQAVYICPECGGMIPDSRKSAMLRQGEWRTVRGTRRGALNVGFWLNTLYSPWVTWSQIAGEWLKAYKDPELLQNFVNSWLAEPWEDLRMRTDADTVLEHHTDVPRWQVPAWAMLLTGGVDVQRGKLYWTLRAWGAGMTSQNIAHGCTDTWSDIATVMNGIYRKDNGEEFYVDMCGIDSGDQTDVVLQFCLKFPEWAVPVKGMPTTPATSSGFRLSYQDNQGATSKGWLLTLVYGDRYKDIIAHRMNLPVGEGCWMVYDGCDEEYAQQVTAEQRVADKNGRETWKPRTSHADNHYLDCEVYAFAVADRLGVRKLGTEEIGPDAGQSAYSASSLEESASSGWLGNTNNWLH